MTNTKKIRELLARTKALADSFEYELKSHVYPHWEPAYPPAYLISQFSNIRFEAIQEVGGNIQDFLYEGHITDSEFRMLLSNLYATLEAQIPEEKLKEHAIDLEKIGHFPKVYFDILQEAQEAYIHGYHRAACTLCGVLWDHLITTNENNSKTKAEKVKSFCVKFGLEKELDIINQLDQWRNNTAHLTTASFNEDKAVIYLKAIKLAADASLKKE